MKLKAGIKRSADKAIKRLEEAADSLKGSGSVKVGLPKGSNAYPDGTSVIMVGTVHEFGSPARGVPQRSFLRSTVVENRNDYKKLIKKLSKNMITGKMDSKKALSVLGLRVQTDVREKITDIDSPKLKSRDGNPLVDTGHLRQSIVYEVED